MIRAFPRVLGIPCLFPSSVNTRLQGGGGTILAEGWLRPADPGRLAGHIGLRPLLRETSHKGPPGEASGGVIICRGVHTFPVDLSGSG